MEQINIEELLRSGKSVSFHPKGLSMWPLFTSPKDRATVVPVDRLLRRGDVCVFRSLDGKLVIHRLVKYTKEGYFFAGDHQMSVEGPIERSAIVGIMTEFDRQGRHYTVRNPIYRMLSFIWLLLLPYRFKLIDFGSAIKNLVRRKS